MPPSPYLAGRWSDGLSIPEYLASFLGLTLVDSAVGGATALPGPAYLGLDPPYGGLTEVYQLRVPSVPEQV